MEQQNIKDALSGKVGCYYEGGTVTRVSVRTGAPVFDNDGSIIGAISAGLRLDRDEIVDTLKARYNVECTIFAGLSRESLTENL